MIKIGAIQEVKKFNKIKLKKKRSVNKVIGIDELTKYLNNEIKLNETKELISIRTRQYAKRQATWARSKMVSWNKIGPEEILNWIKKINKSSLKLDQLI
jgi:tRNA dimethylallyltransferase